MINLIRTRIVNLLAKLAGSEEYDPRIKPITPMELYLSQGVDKVLSNPGYLVPVPKNTDEGKTLEVASGKYALVTPTPVPEVPDIPFPEVGDTGTFLGVDAEGKYALEALPSAPDIPVPEVSDEGKILGVNASGEYALTNAPSGGLPAVTTSDNGSTLMVASGAWEVVKNRNVFLVTLTYANNAWTADKTDTEIAVAKGAGLLILVKCERSGYDGIGINYGGSAALSDIMVNYLVFTAGTPSTTYVAKYVFISKPFAQPWSVTKYDISV